MSKIKSGGIVGERVNLILFTCNTFNAHFLMPEIKGQSLLCSLDSCDVQTPSGYDLPSPCVYSILLAIPILASSVSSLARLLRTFWPTSDGSTFVLL